jgi:hypothetical protein
MLFENIDKLMERNNKLNLIVTKSDNLGKLGVNINNFVIFNIYIRQIQLGKKRKEKKTKIL